MVTRLGKRIFMDDAIRKRLKEVLDAFGITYRSASLAGKLSDTYVAQIFNKGRGSVEHVMTIVRATVPQAFDYVVYGKGKAPEPPPVATKSIKLIPFQGRIDESLISSKCPVLGLAGAGPNGSVMYVDAGVLGYVSVPLGGTVRTVALEVRGDSMRGIANDGWYVYYDEIEDGFRLENLGEMCLVELDSGQKLVKFVRSGSRPGRYNLESTGADIMRDQVIVRSAFITCAYPPRTAKRVAFMEDLD